MPENNFSKLSDVFTVAPLYIVANQNKPSSDYYPTYYRNIDEALDGGLRTGELIVISGETGRGKTTFLQNISKNLSEADIPTLWFTYEMQPYYLRKKFEQMGTKNWEKIFSPTELVENTIDFITQRAKEAGENHQCKILCIDHLHYLIPLDGNSLNTSFVVGSIVRKLKQLAIKENLIIFLIAHTKKIYQDEELSLSSVRDSSLICQESDYVFLVDREKQKKDAQQLKAEAIMPIPYEDEFTNVMVVKLAKNRRTGRNIKQRFDCQNGTLTAQDYQK